MKLTNKQLGMMGMLAAPFLFLQMQYGNKADEYNTSLGGFLDLIYMVGWMGSVVALMRMQAAGTKKRARLIFYVQLALLSVANVWNIWVIFDPANKSTLFFVLDLFWPLSNICMLITGIIIAVKGTLKGWQRYVVLLVGMWLPVLLTAMALLGRNAISGYIGGLYSTIAWCLLGWMVYNSEHVAQEKWQPA